MFRFPFTCILFEKRVFEMLYFFAKKRKKKKYIHPQVKFLKIQQYPRTHEIYTKYTMNTNKD